MIPKIPKYSLSLGGSTGIFVAKNITAASVTIDLTGAYKILWLSVGLRSAFQPESTHLLPYIEAGVWYGVNIGLDYFVGMTSGGDNAPRVPLHNLHLMVGVPIPLWSKRETSSLNIVFVEPYYRPGWGSGGGAQSFSHEVGVLFKWVFEAG